MPIPAPRVRQLTALLAALLAATGVAAACSSAPKHRAAAGRTSVQVSVSQCGAGWQSGKAGTLHLQLRNTDTRPGEARIIDPQSGAVFADVDPFDDDTSTPLDVTLRAGTYAMRCRREDEAPITGRPVRISGTLPASAVASPGVVPVTDADLIPATKAYQRYVSNQLPGLQTDVATLHNAVARGNRPSAERAWLTAHLRYERLGAAYDAFGNLDAAINGRRSTQWSGFHLIEYGLWHGAKLATIAGQVTKLQYDVATLRRQFAHAQLDPLQIGIRAHEISENALQFSLTGEDDYGSHSDLATIRANQQGTEVVLGLVTHLLATRHVDLAGVQAAIRRTDSELGRHPVDRTALDAALSEQCELLAPVAAVLEPRRTS